MGEGEKELREKGAGKGEREGEEVEKEYKANIHHREPENFSPHVFLAIVSHVGNKVYIYIRRT